MPVDIKRIKDALDKFEAEDFVGAKEILQQEIHGARDAYLKDKLELKDTSTDDVGADAEDEDSDADPDVDEACKKKKKVVVKTG